MEPIVASRADGVEPLGGGPAKASIPSQAISKEHSLQLFYHNFLSYLAF